MFYLGCGVTFSTHHEGCPIEKRTTVGSRRVIYPPASHLIPSQSILYSASLSSCALLTGRNPQTSYFNLKRILCNGTVQGLIIRVYESDFVPYKVMITCT